MSKGIDFEYIQRMMDENPDDWHSPEVADLRFQGTLKRILGKPLSREEKDALQIGKN